MMALETQDQAGVELFPGQAVLVVAGQQIRNYRRHKTSVQGLFVSDT